MRAKVRKINEPEKPGIAWKEDIAMLLSRYLPLYYRVARVWMRLMAHLKVHLPTYVLIIANIVAGYLVFFKHRAPVRPPHEALAVTYNLIALNMILVILIIWSLMMRYNRVKVPRGKVTQ